MRDTASSTTQSRKPVVFVFAGFLASAALPNLIGLIVTDYTAAADTLRFSYRTLRIVELAWTVTLAAMIWKIGRSPVFRKR
jgi:formate-dependent nitrite reductase membrane component NrfD